MAEKEWTEELKEEVVQAYKDANPTVENTMEIVSQLAEEYDKSANGVRIVLSRAGVYIKKTPSTTTKKESTGTKRVNKAEAIANLKQVIEDAGKPVDNDICDRLTGKAAIYFSEIIK